MKGTSEMSIAGSLGLVQNSRENLASQTSSQLRDALMAGRFWPGQRLRIRELANAMGVSDTPVREAIIQLVRDGGLEMRPRQSINVVKLSLPRYLEVRDIRFMLEGLATEKAAARLSKRELDQLVHLHDTSKPRHDAEPFRFAQCLCVSSPNTAPSGRHTVSPFLDFDHQILKVSWTHAWRPSCLCKRERLETRKFLTSLE